MNNEHLGMSINHIIHIFVKIKVKRINRRTQYNIMSEKVCLHFLYLY